MVSTGADRAGVACGHGFWRRGWYCVQRWARTPCALHKLGGGHRDESRRAQPEVAFFTKIRHPVTPAPRAAGRDLTPRLSQGAGGRDDLRGLAGEGERMNAIARDAWPPRSRQRRILERASTRITRRSRPVASHGSAASVLGRGARQGERRPRGRHIFRAATTASGLRLRRAHCGRDTRGHRGQVARRRRQGDCGIDTDGGASATARSSLGSGSNCAAQS